MLPKRQITFAADNAIISNATQLAVFRYFFNRVISFYLPGDNVPVFAVGQWPTQPDLPNMTEAAIKRSLSQLSKIGLVSVTKENKVIVMIDYYLSLANLYDQLSHSAPKVAYFMKAVQNRDVDDLYMLGYSAMPREEVFSAMEELAKEMCPGKFLDATPATQMPSNAPILDSSRKMAQNCLQRMNISCINMQKLDKNSVENESDEPNLNKNETDLSKEKMDDIFKLPEPSEYPSDFGPENDDENKQEIESPEEGDFGKSFVPEPNLESETKNDEKEDEADSEFAPLLDCNVVVNPASQIGSPEWRAAVKEKLMKENGIYCNKPFVPENKALEYCRLLHNPITDPVEWFIYILWQSLIDWKWNELDDVLDDNGDPHEPERPTPASVIDSLVPAKELRHILRNTIEDMRGAIEKGVFDDTDGHSYKLKLPADFDIDSFVPGDVFRWMSDSQKSFFKAELTKFYNFMAPDIEKVTEVPDGNDKISQWTRKSQNKCLQALLLETPDEQLTPLELVLKKFSADTFEVSKYGIEAFRIEGKIEEDVNEIAVWRYKPWLLKIALKYHIPVKHLAPCFRDFRTIQGELDLPVSIKTGGWILQLKGLLEVQRKFYGTEGICPRVISMAHETLLRDYSKSAKECGLELPA